MFSYYFVFEVSTSQTQRKLVTKAVNKDGTEPIFFKILMRSFWRLIPFDVFSYLFGSELEMYDKLSSTRLTKKAN
ncbi:RDD family protein [Urechidicola croceus]|uniref:RDD domain-containing protein n=1 Tax=Urechidicola croceus TaxID=1850246 RepID=A0A1D8P642_9FLAO|nr:hypothetical protein [Urechidicola croceus]AOW20043.1 hypothetical protein LPB138_04810 [Urechidicola croceus]